MRLPFLSIPDVAFIGNSIIYDRDILGFRRELQRSFSYLRLILDRKINVYLSVFVVFLFIDLSFYDVSKIPA